MSPGKLRAYWTRALFFCAQTERRGRVELRQKLVRPTVLKADAKAGTVEAVVSTEDKDRDGDIIRQAGWDLKDFLAHPVLVSSHSYNLKSQIGEWTSMKVKDKQLVGTARYYIGEGNDEADWGFNLASKGRAAYSVGFVPNMKKAVEIESDSVFGSWEFNDQELLEVSHVVIPSNPKALQQMKGLGKLPPAVAEVVDEVLKDSNQKFDGQPTVDEIAEAVWKRLEPGIKALLTKEPAAWPLKEAIGKW